MDFAARGWRGHGMTDPELIAALCVRIGMIMEDVCGEAVLARADDRDDLMGILDKLVEASGRISALVAAARAVLNDG
jgi:hypothetical protein